MDAPMTPREAVAWLLENTAATRKTYCTILRSTNGVHNPGTRGMLICQAAELAGRLHAYRESLHHMMQAGMIPADLLDDAVLDAINAAARTIVQAVQENGGEIVIGDDVIYRSFNRARQSQSIMLGGAY